LIRGIVSVFFTKSAGCERLVFSVALPKPCAEQCVGTIVELFGEPAVWIAILKATPGVCEIACLLLHRFLHMQLESCVRRVERNRAATMHRLSYIPDGIWIWYDFCLTVAHFRILSLTRVVDQRYLFFYMFMHFNRMKIIFYAVLSDLMIFYFFLPGFTRRFKSIFSTHGPNN